MGISSALGSSALLPAGLGFRNLVINGGFDINQRGFISSTTTLDFGFDRWPFEYSGGTVTYSAQTFTVGNAISGQEPKNFARIITASQTASSHYAALIQRIESVRTCAGRTATVSFWAKANTGTPKITIEVSQNFGSGGSPSASVNTYAGQVTLSTSWVRYTTTFVVPSISGKTLGTTNDGYLALNLWVSAGSNFDARTSSLGLQNATFDFWGVQFEQNYQPTPFEQRPIGVELALCQRYYETSFPVGVAPQTNYVAGRQSQAAVTVGTQSYASSIFYKVNKRASSNTITFYNPTSASNTGLWYTAAVATNTSTAIEIQTDHMFHVVNANANYVLVQLHWTCSAEL